MVEIITFIFEALTVPISHDYQMSTLDLITAPSICAIHLSLPSLITPTISPSARFTALTSSPPCPPQESDYFTPQGEFRVDKAGSPTLLNCLMYKMSYYRFGEMQVRRSAGDSPVLTSIIFKKKSIN